MKTSLFVMLILGVAAVVQAGVELNVTYSGWAIDPYTFEALDAYWVTLNATGPGEIISAVDITFDGSLHQLMPKRAFPPVPGYAPTAMNDFFADWPPEYLAVDSHFMLSAAQVMFSTTVATEDLDKPNAIVDGDGLLHGWGTYLRSGAMGFRGLLGVQQPSVALAQIVVPHGSDPDWVWINGLVATNQMKDPYMLRGSQTSPFPGDTDHDGDVDLVDLGNLAGGYGLTSGATWETGDFDGDADIDLVDLGTLAGNYFVIPPVDQWIPRDTNHDGDVDLVDLGTISRYFGTTSGATWEMGDFDGDGDVDEADFGGPIVGHALPEYGLPADIDVVPEPGSVLLLMVGVLGLRRQRRRCPVLS
jgi:hypothetical protein